MFLTAVSFDNRTIQTGELDDSAARSLAKALITNGAVSVVVTDADAMIEFAWTPNHKWVTTCLNVGSAHICGEIPSPADLGL